MGYIKDGTFDPLFVVTHRFDIEDFPKLYSKFQQRKGGVEKVFVQTKYSDKKIAGPPLTSIDDL